VEFFSRVGGNVPSAEEVLAWLEATFPNATPDAHRMQEVCIHG
jgi:hypothetical protein